MTIEELNKVRNIVLIDRTKEIERKANFLYGVVMSYLWNEELPKYAKNRIVNMLVEMLSEEAGGEE